MASRDKKSINIKHYKRVREMNIGILIFAVVFIYLIVTILTYATSKRISVYEVREGSIVKDNSYTGLILREETVVNAETEGYVSYFQNEGSKVRAGSNIYALSPKKLDADAASESDAVTLSDEEQKNLILKIQSFNENYNPQKFSSVYTLRNEFSNTVQGASNQTKTAQLDALVAASGGNISVYPSVRDGIIALTFDGYENLTEDKLKASDFDRSQYESASLEDQMLVKAGEPVYKLITSETWNVYIEVDQEMADLLNDIVIKTEEENKKNGTDTKPSVKTRIDKDNEAVWADFHLIQTTENWLCCLTYNTSMIQYAEERFLNVELIMEDQSGLKIPKSAVVEKEFYTIPPEYLTSSGSTSSIGVMIKDGNETRYQEVDVFYSIQEDIEAEIEAEVFLDPEDFEKGTVLVKPESAETLTLSKTKKLNGVYNINKGYAVLKHVNILCENDDYYIVEEGSAYGLTNYDHIVQDGKSVKEEEVVFQ